MNEVLRLDFSTYLPGSVLTKVDRASMANGLEVRPPMLDNEMIDFAFSLPSSVKLCRGRSKAVLKQMAQSLIPPAIIDRRKKGFAIPLAQWLAGPLDDRLSEILTLSPLWQLGILQRETFCRWQREHKNMIVDRSKPLWALLVLDHWYRRNMPPAKAQTAGMAAHAQ